MKADDIIPKPTTFEWDNGNINKNWISHQVSNEEAEEVFDDNYSIALEDIIHSEKEKRYILIGSTDAGLILFIVFTIRADKVRIISARNANRKEVQQYEKATRSTKV